MIDKTDYIVKEKVRNKPRYPGEKIRTRLYKAYCDQCNRDRGYKRKDGLCYSCSAKNRLAKETKQQQKERLLKKVATEQNRSDLEKKKSGDKQRKTKIERGISYKTREERKIADNLRKRLSNSVRGRDRGASAVKDLGCTVEELKKKLELLFQEGMSWGNYGIDGWHIDHIRPLCSFDLLNPEELKKACHYSNLRPLWAKDNLSKSGKIEIQDKPPHRR